jgi:hypothetical protein
VALDAVEDPATGESPAAPVVGLGE